MSSDKKNLDKNTIDNVKGPLGLQGNQYWDDPLSHRDDTGRKRLIASKVGMVIDAPTTVILDKHSSIPVVCLRTNDSKKSLKFSLHTTTQLLTVHLQSGTIELVKLARSPDIIDTKEPSPGFANEWYVADLTKLVPIIPGNRLISLLCGPEISNQRIIEFIPSELPEIKKNYEIQLNETKNKSKPNNYDKAFSLLKIENSTPVSLSNPQLSTSAKSIDNTDHQISITYTISGLPRFIYPAPKPTDPDGNLIYATLPMGFFGFDENRAPVCIETIAIPVINKPAILNGVDPAISYMSKVTVAPSG